MFPLFIRKTLKNINEQLMDSEKKTGGWRRSGLWLALLCVGGGVMLSARTAADMSLLPSSVQGFSSTADGTVSSLHAAMVMAPRSNSEMDLFILSDIVVLRLCLRFGCKDSSFYQYMRAFPGKGWMKGCLGGRKPCFRRSAPVTVMTLSALFYKRPYCERLHFTT